MKRVVLARIPVGKEDEIVLSLDARNRLDVRLWTATGGIPMASANGLTLHLDDVPKHIAALERAAGKEANHPPKRKGAYTRLDPRLNTRSPRL
jgi:hypothetical protein